MQIETKVFAALTKPNSVACYGAAPSATVKASLLSKAIEMLSRRQRNFVQCRIAFIDIVVEHEQLQPICGLVKNGYCFRLGTLAILASCRCRYSR